MASKLVFISIHLRNVFERLQTARQQEYIPGQVYHQVLEALNLGVTYNYLTTDRSRVLFHASVATKKPDQAENLYDFVLDGYYIRITYNTFKFGCLLVVEFNEVF